MTNVTRFGTGNMGTAIGGMLTGGGTSVLEAIGLLQIALSNDEKISWSAGFAVVA